MILYFYVLSPSGWKAQAGGVASGGGGQRG